MMFEKEIKLCNDDVHVWMYMTCALLELFHMQIFLLYPPPPASPANLKSLHCKLDPAQYQEHKYNGPVPT